MKYVLAIDGGGTKTLVWLANETGQVISEGQSGPASLVISPPAVAAANVQTAVLQAVAALPAGQQVSTAFMGLAGVDIPAEVDQARHVFAPLFQELNISDLTLVNDVEIALASGTTAHNALALISGTGSNCFGKNEAGQTAKTSGLDYLLADQGSGYWLGLATLQAAVKSYDGRSPFSLLEALVCQHFKISSVPELKLKVYHPPLTKTQVAELAKVAEKALGEGDAVTQQLFDHLITDLVAMAATVIEKLAMSHMPCECVLVGGMMRVPYVTEQLQKRLKLRYPQLGLLSPEKPPVAGALRLALEKLRH